MKRILIAAVFLLLLLFLLPLLFLPAGIPAQTSEPSPAATLPAGPEADPQDTQPAPEASPAASVSVPSIDAGRTLRLLTDSGISTVSMDKYLFGVVAAEMPAAFHPEALKAQTIAARTYALYKMRHGPSKNHPDADLCTNYTCCSAYSTEAEARTRWGDKQDEYAEKLRRAVSETDGQAILYDGTPINAVFHSSSSGATERAALVWGAEVPYLTSVASPESGDTVPNYNSTAEFSAEAFRTAFLAAYPSADLSGAPGTWFVAPERSDAGKVLRISVGGVSVSGQAVRTLFGLRSTAFSIDVRDDNVIVFSVTGYGHGVGMSQYGANAYAAAGWDCQKILTWYYQGTTVGMVEG